MLCACSHIANRKYPNNATPVNHADRDVTPKSLDTSKRGKKASESQQPKSFSNKQYWFWELIEKFPEGKVQLCPCSSLACDGDYLDRSLKSGWMIGACWMGMMSLIDI